MIITQSIWHLEYQELQSQQNHVPFANHSNPSFLWASPLLQAMDSAFWKVQEIFPACQLKAKKNWLYLK